MKQNCLLFVILQAWLSYTLKQYEINSQHFPVETFFEADEFLYYLSPTQNFYSDNAINQMYNQVKAMDKYTLYIPAFTCIQLINKITGFIPENYSLSNLPLIFNTTIIGLNTYNLTQLRINQYSWLSSNFNILIYTYKDIQLTISYGIRNITIEYLDYFLKKSCDAYLLPQLINNNNYSISQTKHIMKGFFPVINNNYISPVAENFKFMSNENLGYIVYGPNVPTLSYSWVQQLSIADIVVAPYLPYFTNCDTFGDFIMLENIFNDPSCTFVPEDDVIPINLFGFGKKAVAHTCSDVTTYCRISKSFLTDFQPSDTCCWYTTDIGTELFHIYKYIATNNTLDASTYKTDDIIPVTVISAREMGKFPLSVMIKLYYYQVDKTEKNLVKGTIEFQGYSSVDSANGLPNLEYEVSISLIPYSHTQLLVEFSLSWILYIVIYTLIGMSSVVMVGIFFLYNYLYCIFARRNSKNQKNKPSFIFFEYLKLIYLPIAKGIMLAFPPIFIYLFLVSIFLGGHVIQKEFWESYHVATLEGSDHPKISAFHPPQYIYNGRICVCIFVGGAFGLYISSSISDKKHPTLTISDNIFPPHILNTLVVILSSMFIVLLETGKIFFSFSSYFGQYIWYLVAANKVFNIVVDYCLSKIFPHLLQYIHITSFLNASESLITWGSNDFIDFLTTFIIETGILMGDRTYFSAISEKFTDLLDEFLNSIKEKFKALGSAKGGDENEEEEEEKKVQEKNVEKENDRDYKVTNNQQIQNDKSIDLNNLQNESHIYDESISDVNYSSGSEILLSDRKDISVFDIDENAVLGTRKKLKKTFFMPTMLTDTNKTALLKQKNLKNQQKRSVSTFRSRNFQDNSNMKLFALTKNIQKQESPTHPKKSQMGLRPSQKSFAEIRSKSNISSSENIGMHKSRLRSSKNLLSLKEIYPKSGENTIKNSLILKNRSQSDAPNSNQYNSANDSLKSPPAQKSYYDINSPISPSTSIKVPRNELDEIEEDDIKNADNFGEYSRKTMQEMQELKLIPEVKQFEKENQSKFSRSKPNLRVQTVFKRESQFKKVFSKEKEEEKKFLDLDELDPLLFENDILEKNAKKKLQIFDLNTKKANMKKNLKFSQNQAGPDKKNDNVMHNDLNISRFADATSEIIAGALNPCVTLWIWMFFDEIGISLEYGVTKQGIIYYFLFSLLIIPFQMVIDLLFFNILTYYHNCNFILLLQSWKKRYDSRSKKWKIHDFDINDKLPFNLQKLDQFCFSSQYYFVITVKSSSMVLIVLGLVGILQNSYNPLYDYLAIVYTLASLIFASITAKSYYFVCCFLRFWDLKRNKRVYTTIKSLTNEELHTDLEFHGSDGQNTLKKLTRSKAISEKNYSIPAIDLSKKIFVFRESIKEQAAENLKKQIYNLA